VSTLTTFTDCLTVTIGGEEAEFEMRVSGWFSPAVLPSFFGSQGPLPGEPASFDINSVEYRVNDRSPWKEIPADFLTDAIREQIGCAGCNAYDASREAEQERRFAERSEVAAMERPSAEAQAAE
jgi:hypothetical protein